MLLNPWVWIGTLLYSVTLAFGAYQHGRTVEAGKQAIAQQTAIIETDKAVRSELELAVARADKAEQAARQAAENEAKAKAKVIIKTREIRSANPVPATCIPDGLRDKIDASIRAVNAGAADAKPMPAAVPGSARVGIKLPE